MSERPTIGPTTSPVVNVLLGWFGERIPPIPKPRNNTRAAHRKTDRKRPRPKASP